MAQSFDGDIRLSVGIDPRQVTEVINKLGRSISSTFGTATNAVESTNKAVTNLDTQTTKTNSTVKNLNTSIQQTNQSVSKMKTTKGADDMRGAFERAGGAIDKVVNKMFDAFKLEDNSNKGSNVFADGFTRAGKALDSLYNKTVNFFRIEENNPIEKSIKSTEESAKSLGSTIQSATIGFEKMSEKERNVAIQIEKKLNTLEDLRNKQTLITEGAQAKEQEKLQKEIDNTIAKIEKLKVEQEVIARENKVPALYASMEESLDKIITKQEELYNKIQALKAKAAAHREAHNLIDANRVQDEINKLQPQFDKLISQEEVLRERMEAARRSGAGPKLGTETAQYAKLNSEIESLEKNLEYLRVQQEQLNTTLGGKEGAQYQKLTNDIRITELELQSLYAKQAQLGSEGEKTGKQMSNGYKSVANGAKKSAKKIEDYFKGAFNKIKNTGSKMVGGLKGIFSKLRGHAKDSADGMEKSFRKGFKMLLKYAIGVRSFYFLFRKIRAAAKESLTAMAQQFPEVNAQLSALKNSFIQLKGSVGTVAQPLLQVLAPALTAIINLLSQAATAVGNFLALLTGQKYIYKANKATTSFADAQDASTGATKANTEALKENQKQLGQYDKLNIIDQDKDKSGAGGGGGGAGAGGGEMTFEKVPVDSAISDFVSRLKKAWKNADFTDIGIELGTKLKNALSKIKWNKLQTEAEKMGKRLGTLIAGFISVPGLAKKIGETIGQALNTLLLNLQSFIKSVPWKNFGVFLADMFSSAFLVKDKNGRSLIGNIVKTLVDVLNAVIDTFIGFVGGMKDKWSKIGEEISKWLQWAIENIKIAEFATAIGEFINGLVTLISKVLGKRETWIAVGKKIAQSINNLFHTIKWGELAKAISDTAMGFLTMIETALSEVDWEAVGNAIADFLANIDWLGILGKVASIIVNVFWGAIKALFSESNSFSAGVVKAIIAAFGTIFVASKFTGLVGIIKGCFGGTVQKGLVGAVSATSLTAPIAGGLKGVLGAVASHPLLIAGVAALGLSIGKQLGDALAEDEGALGGAFRQIVESVASIFGSDGKMMTEKQWQALKARAAAAKAAVEAELKPITKLLDDANKSLEDSNKSVDTFNKKIATIETGGKKVEEATRIFNELSKKTHLTAVETEALKNASATLAKKYPELNKYIDKNNGILKISQKQLDKITEKVKRHKKAIEAQKEAEQLYANQAPLKKALDDAQKAYDDAFKKMTDYQATWKKTYDDWNKGLVDDATMAEANKTMQGYSNAVLKASSALDKARTAQDKNNKAMEKANNLIELGKVSTEEMAEADDKLKESLKNLNVPASEQKQIMKELKEAVKNGTMKWSDYKKIVDKNYKSVGDLKTELNKVGQQKVSPTLNVKVTGKEEMKRVQEYFSQFKGGKKEYTIKLNWYSYVKDDATRKALASGSVSDLIEAQRKINKKATGGIYTGSGWHDVQGYASGGTPKSGQFFMARENGIPELVGTIRNHTAVMNNNQIVASVANGVYQAVASVARVILPYVRSQTHAMNWLAQNGLQLPDITIGNILPSNSNFLNALRGMGTTTNITNGVDYEMLVKAFKEAQTNQPIVVQMPNGKVLAEVVWNEEEKKYKQARSSTLQVNYA